MRWSMTLISLLAYATGKTGVIGSKAQSLIKFGKGASRIALLLQKSSDLEVQVRWIGSAQEQARAVFGNRLSGPMFTSPRCSQPEMRLRIGRLHSGCLTICSNCFFLAILRAQRIAKQKLRGVIFGLLSQRSAAVLLGLLPFAAHCPDLGSFE